MLRPYRYMFIAVGAKHSDRKSGDFGDKLLPECFALTDIMIVAVGAKHSDRKSGDFGDKLLPECFALTDIMIVAVGAKHSDRKSGDFGDKLLLARMLRPDRQIMGKNINSWFWKNRVSAYRE